MPGPSTVPTPSAELAEAIRCHQALPMVWVGLRAQRSLIEVGLALAARGDLGRVQRRPAERDRDQAPQGEGGDLLGRRDDDGVPHVVFS